MPAQAVMVLTTIRNPSLLEGYRANFAAHGHLEQIRVFVVPDRKTPGTVFARCAALRKRGLKVECPRLDEQESFLCRIGFPPELIPYNSDNRRNVGYLMALEAPSDFLISIDDDNHCPGGEDFFQAHAVVCGERVKSRVVEATSGWLNICDLLDLEPSLPVYPRGFPFSARHRPSQIQEAEREVRVRINAGLWLQEPDLDGITWLAAPVRARSFKGASVILGSQTWTPVNTQNTALHREVIPSYYFLRMGYALAGMVIDRYGDIFSGYFSQACVRHCGDSVRAGAPVATHVRNSHNYLRDLTQELACIWVLEDLLPWLKEQRLDGKTYSDAYLSLSHLLEQQVARFTGFIWTDPTRDYFHSVAQHMREWVRACHHLN